VLISSTELEDLEDALAQSMWHRARARMHTGSAGWFHHPGCEAEVADF
jgi:hypothetical protein